MVSFGEKTCKHGGERTVKKIVSIGAALMAAAVFGYDLHTKALTPVRENAKPNGTPVVLVQGYFDNYTND